MQSFTHVEGEEGRLPSGGERVTKDGEAEV